MDGPLLQLGNLRRLNLDKSQKQYSIHILTNKEKKIWAYQVSFPVF